MAKLRWGVYALLLIAVLTVAVHVKLWLSGLDNSLQTIYRVVPRYVEVPRDRKAEKGFVTETTTRKVQILRTKGSPKDTPPDSAPGLQTPAPEEPALLGIFQLGPLPRGGQARATLDEAGKTHLEVKEKAAGLLELGRLRELGLWGGFRVDDPSVRTWSISYQQDVVRIGPGWLRARAELLDDLPDAGPYGKVEVGAVFRF